MYQLLAPIIIFQIYCFYHIYSRKSESYWYYVILLFPLIGALFYFINQYQNRHKIQPISEMAVPKFDNSITIKNLENEARQSDTVSNKIRLADAYMLKEDYEKALEIYKSCSSKLTQDDEELNTKLLVAYHLSGDYLSGMMIGNQLNKTKFFQNAPEKAYYAWSFFELHDDEKAEQYFQEMNIANTNYGQRKEFAKFLIEIEKKEEAKALVTQMLEEIEEMDAYEKDLLKDKIKEIKTLAAGLK